MGLRTENQVRHWPAELSPPTRLQEHLHKPHIERWERIINALWLHHERQTQGWATRLANCCAVALVAQDQGTGRVWPWLSRCGSRLCPFCGRGRARRVAHQIAYSIGKFDAPKHIILTYRSNQEPLERQLPTIRLAFTKLRRQPAWKNRVKAGVYTIEITRNKHTALWHPHLHVIIDSPYFPQPLLAKLWSECMPEGYHVWIRAVHDTAAACMEISKYVGQAPLMDDWPDHAIISYARAVHGTRMLQSFGKALHRDLPEPDEPKADPPKTFTVSVSQLSNAANAGIPVAQDLVALMWSRWPMLRSYLQSKAPDFCRGGPLRTNTALTCPAPPTLPNGRTGAHPVPAIREDLDNALDLTMLYLRGLQLAGQLDLTDYISQYPE